MENSIVYHIHQHNKNNFKKRNSILNNSDHTYTFCLYDILCYGGTI